MQTATRSSKTPRSPIAAKKAAPAPPRATTTRAAKTARTGATAAAVAESVPLLVYVPRRARERLNKLVRDHQLANQAEAITKLINDAYKKA